MNMKSLTLAALAAGAAPSISALQAADTVNGQMVIVVTAERRDTELARSTSVTEVITSDDADDAGHPFNTFELFRSLPGVDVTNGNGGIDGGTTSIRLRGGRSQDTRYLLDGIPLSDPTTIDGVVNASVIPSTGLDHIEVVKGSQGGLYGANAVGGVINMISRRPTADQQAEALAEAGSFGTVRGAAGASGMLSDTLGYALDADGLSSKGFSATTQPGVEGRPNGNEADGVRRGGVRGRLEWTPNRRLSVYGSALHQATNQDYDASNPNDDGATLQTRLTRGATGAAWTITPQLDVAVDAASTVQQRLYDEPSSLSYNPTGMYEYVLHEQYASGRATLKPGAGLACTVSGDGTWDHGESSRFDNFDRTVGGYAQLAHSSRYSEVSGSVRRDENAYAGGATTWHVGAAAFDAQRIVKPHATVGTGFIAPTLEQRFAYYPGDPDPMWGYPATVGNAELQPERSLSRDVGLTLAPAPQIGATIDVTGWRTDYHDKIAYIFGDMGLGTPSTYQNVSTGRVEGVELSATLDDRGIPFKARISATWQWFEDETNVIQRLLPQDKARFEAGWRFTRVWLGAHVDAIGTRWNRTGTVRDVPGYALVGATVSWDIDRIWTVYARGENLTDTHYEVNPGGYHDYTSAPIAAYAGVIAHF